MAKITDWNARPAEMFRQFIRSPDFAATARRLPAEGAVPAQISEETAANYDWMFGRFIDWIRAAGVPFSAVEGASIFAYLQQVDENGKLLLNSTIARRYVRLLERCYQYLEVWPNPGAAAILDALRHARPLGKDQAMHVLKEEQLQAFISALPDPNDGWKRWRDRAMQLAMLMGGLKVAEAIGLMTNEVDGQANFDDLDEFIKIRVTPEGKQRSSYEHSTIVRQPGASELVAWVHHRKTLRIPGPLLFPANFRGEPLNKATVYRQVKATFARANLDVRRAGGRTLRNTFAVKELDEVGSEVLKEHLGLALARSTEVYARAKEKLK